MSLFSKLFNRWSPGSTYEAALSTPGVHDLAVNDASAVRLPPAYRACTMLARDIARAPRSIRTRSGEFLNDSPILDLLDNPHPLYNGNRWFSFMVFELVNRGESLAAIVRDGNGDVVSLVPMPAGTWALSQTDGMRDIGYRLSGISEWVGPEEVLHFKLENPGGYWLSGDSAFGLCNAAVQQLQEQQETAVSVVQNLGRPRLAIRHPGKPSASAMENIKNSYRMTQTGANNAGAVMVLPEAMDLKEVKPSVIDADFESARRYSIDDVARITGVPASLLANRHDVKYSTLSDEYAAYVSSALSQYAAIMSAEFGKLLGAGRLEFDFSQVLRPAKSEVLNGLIAGVNAGIMTPNEARADLGMNPIEGGDIIDQSMNQGATIEDPA